VSLGLVVAQRGVARQAAAREDRAARQGDRGVGIPGLRGGGDGRNGQREDQHQQTTHRAAISRGFLAAASALLLACGGGGTGPSGTPRAALLALAQADTFSPATKTYYVQNNLTTHVEVVHSDPSSTVFADITFTPLSIFSLDGQGVCDTCTVGITVTVQPGTYFFSVGPAGIRFDAANQPTMTISYGTFGDPSVFDSTARYADPGAFEAALELWHERHAGAWYLASGSGPGPGTSQVSAALEGPGNYLVAALK